MKKQLEWTQETLFSLDDVPETHEVVVRKIVDWWMAQAAGEASTMVPRAVEYGAADLALMGEAMFAMMPQCRGVVAGEELAIAFYTLGKVARLFGAYEQGMAPKDDTWDDLAIYARMAKYVRENGAWAR